MSRPASAVNLLYFLLETLHNGTLQITEITRAVLVLYLCIELCQSCLCKECQNRDFYGLWLISRKCYEALSKIPDSYFSVIDVVCGDK